MALSRFTGADIAQVRKTGPKINPSQMMSGMLKSGTSVLSKNHRDGFASINDADYSKSYAQKYGQGSYSVKAVDGQGNDIKDGRPIVQNGKIFYPNSKGVYTFFDTSMLDEMSAKSDEHEAYVDSIIDRCKTDDTLAMLCQLSLTDLKKVCKGATAEFKAVVGDDVFEDIADEIRNSNCQPSLLTTLHPNTLQFALGVSKLRYLVKSVLPIISDQSASYNPALVPSMDDGPAPAAAV